MSTSLRRTWGTRAARATTTTCELTRSSGEPLPLPAGLPADPNRPLASTCGPRPGAARNVGFSPARPGCPPRLRGINPTDLACWAIACRASAAVLDLEGHDAPAARLRRVAAAADRWATRLGAADASACRYVTV